MVEALKLRWGDLAGDRLIRRLQDSTPQSVLSRWFGSRQAQLQADRLLLARQRAAEALGHLGLQRAVKSLMHAVQDPSRLVRRAAIEALGKIADPASLPALLPELQDRERDVRAAAANAIAMLGQTKAVDPLIQAWRKESEGEVRLHLGQAILKLDPTAAEAAGIT